jgi:dolichol kinase
MCKKNDDAPSIVGSGGMSVRTAAPIAAVVLVTVAATGLLLEAPSQMLQVGISVSLIVLLQVAASLLSLERESKRRLQHATTGFCFVMAPKFFPLPPLITAMSVAAAGIWYLSKYQRDTFLSFFGGLLRPFEVKSGLPGAFYFIVGTVAVWTLFSMDVSNYALLCLSLADPIAAVVGQSIRSPKLTLSSSVAGSFACFVTAWIIGVATLGQEGYSMWTILRGAVVCTVAEAISLPGGLNDNLLIPVLTGFAINGIRLPNY